MQKRKTPLFLPMAVLWATVLVFFCQTAYGATPSYPDPDALGSITVAMKDDEQKPIGGGSLTLFPFAELSEKDGNYSWAYTEEYQFCGLSLKEFDTDSFAASLHEYIATKGLTGTQAAIPSSGTVVFNDLPAGLYLIVQPVAAEGYYAIKPFVVSVPFQEESGEWAYQVDAFPKMEIKPITVEPTPTPIPTPHPPPKLPQTGQLNWPIPLLAGAGVLLFLVGWDLAFLRRRKHHGP